MSHKSLILWASLPPGVVDLRLFREAAGVGEPFVDLRFGEQASQDGLLKTLQSAPLPGLTICIDAGQIHALADLLKTPPPEMRVVVGAPCKESELLVTLSSLRDCGVAAGVEVFDAASAMVAARCGADFLIAAGSEASGPVSNKTSLILLQELVHQTDLPLVIRGGLGPRGAAAAAALGAAGIILDSQLLLLEESGLSKTQRDELLHRSVSDTELVGQAVGRPFRLLATGGKDTARALLAKEWEIESQDLPAGQAAAAFAHAMAPVFEAGFSGHALPVGQGLAFAQQFARAGMNLAQILDRYQREITESIARVKRAFPFYADSPLAKQHGVRFPIVQGPMALVTDTPRLAPYVLRHGGLPFCSTAGLKPDRIRELLKDARGLIGNQPFGLGIIGFLPLEGADQAVLGEGALRPDFVTIAGGNPEQARTLEQNGIKAYIHAPSESLIRDLLDHGVRGLILEGHEAGGHVGVLGSLVLWELATEELLSRPQDKVAGIRVLFAGGIANAASSLAAAVIAAPLAEYGIAVGLQLGTAYMMTDDAVESGVVTAGYQAELLHGRDTVLTGRSVNLPNRWLDTTVVRKLIREETSLEGSDLAFRDRKRTVEALGTPRFLAALGRNQSLTERACVCGQGIAVQHEAWTIEHLHESLTAEAQQLAETCPGMVEDGDTLHDAIAIVGMGCVFPGATGVQQFWDNILARRDYIREVPESHWDTNLFYDQDRSKPERTYSKIGAFVEGFKKDPIKFRIPPTAEPQIDPVQFFVLESVYQALVDAGYLEDSAPPSEATIPRATTGVFVGHGSESSFASQFGMRANWVKFAEALRSAPDFAELPAETRERVLSQGEEVFKRHLPQFSEDTCGGVFSSLVAGRVANVFDLRGPAVVSDAACASAMAAVDAAVSALRRREIDLALAGGADIRIDSITYLFFCSLGALSANGSFPFDERADGFVLGEGAGMLALKRLDDAVRDGDRVYAVIRAVGSSSDGRVKGITAPDVDGQMRALDRTYRQVPFSAASVRLMEAHGTGTWAGDKAEITSITRYFTEQGAGVGSIGIGSVKSMIGHLKTAAGAAGLIKMAMALHNKVLPPTMHCETPRKDIDWPTAPCYLVTQAELWHAGHHPRRGAVNAFGFGGINFHAVLEEAPVVAPKREVLPPAVLESVQDANLYLLRSPSRTELIARLQDLVNTDPGADPRRLALEHAARNSDQGPSLALVARGREELNSHARTALELLADTDRDEISAAQGIYFRETPLDRDAKVAFLFPGQGVQYPGMLEGIEERFPFVTPVLERVDAVARKYIRHSILGILNRKDGDDVEHQRELLQRPDYNHPAMLAVSSALQEILKRAGIAPDMVAGHSLGEYAALHVAGVYDAEAAIRITTQRGSGMATSCMNHGVMASISLSEQEVQPYLADAGGFVAVANKNCPAQTVISGEEAPVARVLEQLGKEGVRSVRLNVACGFHSRLVEPAMQPFRRLLDAFPVRSPRVPVQSNLTGTAYTNGTGFPERLRDMLARHMVEPVDFIGNIQSLYDAGARLFVEVGPGSTLSSFVDNTLADQPHWTVSTNIARRDPVLQALHAVASCAAMGLRVDLERLQPVQYQHRPLRSTRTPGDARAAPKVARVSAPPPPGLVEQALPGADAATRERYLAARGEFLRQMVALDFAHFTQTPSQAAPAPAAAATGLSDEAAESLTKLVVDLVARRTGYPAELIGLDLDIEAELGLDSIKQVEIVRELARELKLDLGSDARGAGYHITTLRDLIQRTARSLDAGQAPVPTSEPAPAPAAPEPAPQLGYATDCHRLVSALVAAPAPQGGGWLRGKAVFLLTRETQLAPQVAREIAGQGAHLTNTIESADCVVDLVSAESRPLPPLEGVHDWWREAQTGMAEILEMAQQSVRALRATPPRKLRWCVVSRLGGDLGATGTPAPGAATGAGLGLARIAALENPDQIELYSLDFEASTSSNEIAAQVGRELDLEAGPAETGYRSGRRYEIRWKKEDAGSAQQGIALGPASVVLAVGGTRGVTALICHELARRSKARFIVMGQGPEPPSDSTAKLTFAEVRAELLAKAAAEKRMVAPAELDREAWRQVWLAERTANMTVLRSLAAGVEYVQCDLRDPAQVDAWVGEFRQRYPKVDVVIHGAGRLVTKSIPDFTVADLVDATAPKALSTLHLISALEGIEVGAFLNLSSIGGRWGNVGHGAYASGHEIAAALTAQARSQRAGRWCNIYFGPWLDIGMTATGEVMERLRKVGASFITAEDGGDFMAREIECGVGGSIGYFGGTFLDRRLASIDSAPQAPFLDEVQFPESGVAVGRREFDPLREAFVSAHRVAEDTYVLAGVLMIEMMAQVAGTLADPDAEVTEIRNAAFRRTAKFPQNKPRTFYVRAQAETEPGWFACELYSFFQPPNGAAAEQIVHATARMGYGQRKAPPPPGIVVAENGLGSQVIDVKPLWSTKALGLRRGMFGNFGDVQSVTADGTICRALGHPIPELGPTPRTGDPILLDGVTLAGITTTALYYGRRSYYMKGIRSIEFFAQRQVTTQPLIQCRRGVRSKGELSTFEIYNADGNVAVRVSDYDRVPAVQGEPPEFYDEPIWESLREHARQKEIRRLLGTNAAWCTAQTNLVMLDSALAYRADRILKEILSSQEHAHWESLTHPKRRREWLGGRMAAKAAVRMLYPRHAPLSEHIEIRNGEGRAPIVTLLEATTAGETPSVSIAHSGDKAVAIASFVAGFGIDVEVAGAVSAEVADSFTSATELAILKQAMAEAGCGLTALWSAKEAARKALGAHTTDARGLILRAASRDGEYTVLTFEHGNAGLRCVLFTEGGYTYAVAGPNPS